MRTASPPVVAPSLKLAVDPNDARYPRPRAFGVLRWILRLGWLAFLVYPANALFNVLALVADGTPLSGATISHALLLDRLLPLFTQRPLVALLGVAAVLAIVSFGRVAHLDQERE